MCYLIKYEVLLHGRIDDAKFTNTVTKAAFRYAFYVLMLISYFRLTFCSNYKIYTDLFD